MKKVLILIVMLCVLSVSCGSNCDDTGEDKDNIVDSADSAADGDTANTADIGDSADSVVDGDTVDTTDSVDFSDDEEQLSDEDVVALSSNIIPTNQTECYDNIEAISCPAVGADYYGQDAQYLDTKRTFTVSGEAEQEIVTDSITGLIWQRTIDSTERTWEGAKDYCSELEYAGYADWRLPTIEALATLSDYGHYDPAIDSGAFPATPSDVFLSSTSSFYSVKSIDGKVDAYSESSGNARCVRGTFSFASDFVEYEVAEGNTLIKDMRTGLMWTKRYWEAKSWKEALEYCENLEYMRTSDWRLPNINELRTLIDYSKNGPASNFPDMPENDSFWSSTTHSEFTGSVWSVRSGSGAISAIWKEGVDIRSFSVRCVRISGSNGWYSWAIRE
ncbi:DUF1566 domain-containing protein [bacterium]|nr:DUF1566 domain-containing protein [bacterium]